MGKFDNIPEGFDWMNHSHLVLDELPDKEDFKQFQQDTIIKAIGYLKHHPDAVEAFNDQHPFNSPKLKGVDFAKVEDAYFKGDKLIIKYYEF